MLPRYADGSTGGPARGRASTPTKGGKRAQSPSKTKRRSKGGMGIIGTCMCCILYVWVIVGSWYLYDHMEQLRGDNSEFMLAPVLLGTKSAPGSIWIKAVREVAKLIDHHAHVQDYFPSMIGDIKFESGEYFNPLESEMKRLEEKRAKYMAKYSHGGGVDFAAGAGAESGRAREEKRRMEVESKGINIQEKETRKDSSEVEQERLRIKQKAEEEVQREQALRAKQQAEEVARKQQEERKIKQQAEDDAKKQQEELLAKRKAEEDEQKKQEELRAKKQAEEDEKKQEEEIKAKRQSEEVAKKQEEELRAKQQAEDNARKEQEELKAKQQAEEDAKKQEQEVRAKQQAEEDAKKQEQELRAKQQQAEEAAKKEEEELRAKKQAEENAQKEAQELQAKQQAEEDAKKQEEEEVRAKKQAEEDAKKEEEERRAKQQAEEDAKKQEEELRARQQAQEDAKKQEEELRAKQQAEDDARKEAERLRQEHQDAAVLPPLQREKFDWAKVAICVIVFDKHDVSGLKTTLESLENLPLLREVDLEKQIYVSQDVQDNRINSVIVHYQAKGLVKHLYHDVHEEVDSVKFAQHQRLAMDAVFTQPEDYSYVIFLEQSLEFSKDFLVYFQATAPLLEKDPSLLGISAFHEHGFREMEWKNEKLFRNSYVSGVSWMMPRDIWKELSPRWPRDNWVEWLNSDGVRKDRDVVTPEVSRTRRLGGGAFYAAEAKYQNLYDSIQVSTIDPDPTLFGDLEYMYKSNFDKEMTTLIESSRRVEPFAPIIDAGRDLSLVQKPYPRYHHQFKPLGSSSVKLRCCLPACITTASSTTAQGSFCISGAHLFSLSSITLLVSQAGITTIASPQRPCYAGIRGHEPFSMIYHPGQLKAIARRYHVLQGHRAM